MPELVFVGTSQHAVRLWRAEILTHAQLDVQERSEGEGESVMKDSPHLRLMEPLIPACISLP